MNRVNKRNLFIAAAMFMTLCIGGVMALFTDTDEEINTFTIGDVDIDLTEPSFEPPTNIVPNAKIDKDPVVTNTTTTNDCYVYLKVEIPTSAATASDAVEKQLFYMNSAAVTGTDPAVTADSFNSGWTELVSERSFTAGSGSKPATVSRVFVYGTESAPSALAASDTTETALFSSVTLRSDLDQTMYADTIQNIDVNAYAIQTSGLSSATSAGIWEILMGQETAAVEEIK